MFQGKLNLNFVTITCKSASLSDNHHTPEVLYVYSFHQTEYLKLWTQVLRCSTLTIFTVSSLTFLNEAGLIKNTVGQSRIYFQVYISSTTWYYCTSSLTFYYFYTISQTLTEWKGPIYLTTRKTVLTCGPPERVLGPLKDCRSYFEKA